MAQSFGARLRGRPSANNDHGLRARLVPLGHRLHQLDALQLGLVSAHLHLSGGIDLDLKLVQAVQTGEVLDVARLDVEAGSVPRAPHDAVAESAAAERGPVVGAFVRDGVDLPPVLDYEARLVTTQLKLLRCALLEVGDFAHDTLDDLLVWGTRRSGADGPHRRYAAPLSLS